MATCRRRCRSICRRGRYRNRIFDAVTRREVVELSVERIGAGGDGIARWRGEPVYLPFTATGDRVRARLGARRGGGREGRVVEVIMPGPGHSPPPCPHFGRCGGCALQHLDPAAYRTAKLG